eukprot:15466401-Alexandrium_andersonii.AAC.1
MPNATATLKAAQTSYFLAHRSQTSPRVGGSHRARPGRQPQRQVAAAHRDGSRHTEPRGSIMQACP